MVLCKRPPKILVSASAINSLNNKLLTCFCADILWTNINTMILPLIMFIFYFLSLPYTICPWLNDFHLMGKFKFEINF